MPHLGVSLRTRLTFWYALSATVTLAILFLAGYQLLETRLIKGLDQPSLSKIRPGSSVRVSVDYRVVAMVRRGDLWDRKRAVKALWKIAL